ncbi:MAG TPA: hypothetical protein PK156_46645 [Polyangium sp.]|nr:hypothetical protein [Polyangium sp.]
MSDRSTTESANGIVTATLAIPGDAIRVIAAPPDTLTQRNVEAVTGLPPRVYLEVIRTLTFPLRVAKLGKLRIVNRVAFVEWLERQDVDAIATERNDVKAKASNAVGDILDLVGFERSRELPKRRKRSTSNR